MELWDVYTADRTPTGRTARRGIDELMPGEFHLSVHVVLINSRGQLLLQRRSMDKKGWPGMWDIAAAAGSVLAGETSRQAAQRELFEELGLNIEVNCAPRITTTMTNCFGDWYVLHTDASVDTLLLQPGEVMEARWIDPEEISAMLDDGRMVDYHPGIVGMLTQLDGTTGAMRSLRGAAGKVSDSYIMHTGDS